MRDAQQKSSISVALEDGTRSWDPLRDIPTKSTTSFVPRFLCSCSSLRCLEGVFWRAITSGRPIVCKLVASPTGIMVTGQEKDVATWTSLFNVSCSAFCGHFALLHAHVAVHRRNTTGGLRGIHRVLWASKSISGFGDVSEGRRHHTQRHNNVQHELERQRANRRF